MGTQLIEPPDRTIPRGKWEPTRLETFFGAAYRGRERDQGTKDTEMTSESLKMMNPQRVLPILGAVLVWIGSIVIDPAISQAAEANALHHYLPKAEAIQRPNVILVFIDDMGWGDLTCFGNNEVKTQNIDRLAKEGIRFEQFYVNSPICSPSRVAISTGQYPQRWKITSYLNNRQNNLDRGMAQWLDPRAPMLAR